MSWINRRERPTLVVLQLENRTEGKSLSCSITRSGQFLRSIIGLKLKTHCFCLRCAFWEEKKQYFEEHRYTYQSTNFEVSIIT